MPDSDADPDHKPLLVLATHNQGKLAELRAMVGAALPHIDGDTAVVDAGTLGLPDVVEDGLSFQHNALLKARAAAAASGLPVVADDSGLSVDVLGGAPGIFSARWAGKHGDDRANMELLLAQLADIAHEHRAAAFVCAAALVTPDGYEHVEHGVLKGTLLSTPVGDQGFGYDPVMQPEGMTVSCAQLSAKQKNAISHRAQAMKALLPHIVKVLGYPGEVEQRGTGKDQGSSW